MIPSASGPAACRAGVRSSVHACSGPVLRTRGRLPDRSASADRDRALWRRSPRARLAVRGAALRRPRRRHLVRHRRRRARRDHDGAGVRDPRLRRARLARRSGGGAASAGRLAARSPARRRAARRLDLRSPTVEAVLEAYQEQRALGVEAVARDQLDALQRRDRALARAAPVRRPGRRRPRRPRRRQRRTARARVAARDQPLRIAAPSSGRRGPGDLRSASRVCRATVAPIAAADGVRLGVPRRRRGASTTLRRRPRRRGRARIMPCSSTTGRSPSTSTGPALATLAAHLRRRELPARERRLRGGRRAPRLPAGPAR